MYTTCKFDKSNESLDKALIFITHWLRIVDDVGVNSLNIYDLPTLGQPSQIRLNSLFLLTLWKIIISLFKIGTIMGMTKYHWETNQNYVQRFIWPNWTNILHQHRQSVSPNHLSYYCCGWCCFYSSIVVKFIWNLMYAPEYKSIWNLFKLNRFSLSSQYTLNAFVNQQKMLFADVSHGLCVPWQTFSARFANEWFCFLLSPFFSV